jgi:hypothetical protein
VTRPRAADDFATIRARMVELRREREGAPAAECDLQRDPPMHRPKPALAAARDWPAPGWVYRSGSSGG